MEGTIPEEKKLAICYNAVKEFSRYGLFGNLSIEQAYKLVTRWYKPSYTDNGGKQPSYLVNKNAFCLVNGRTNYTYSTHRYTNWMIAFGNILYWKGFEVGLALLEKYPFIIFLVPFWFIFSLGSIILGFALSARADMNPLAILDVFGIGCYSAFDKKNYSALGWIQTFGALGLKTWEGNISGNLPGWTIPYDPFFNVLVYPAVWGFSGIKLWLNEDGSEKSYFGSAIAIGIDIVK